MTIAQCEHYSQQVGEGVQPRANLCEECGIVGPLRMCATCGYVGCCESRNSHDTRHWEKTGHAIIIQMPLEEGSFVWCYADQKYLKR